MVFMKAVFQYCQSFHTTLSKWMQHLTQHLYIFIKKTLPLSLLAPHRHSSPVKSEKQTIKGLILKIEGLKNKIIGKAL